MKTSNLYCSFLAFVLLGCVLPSRAEDLSTNAVTAAWIPWGDSTCVSNEDVLFSPWPDWMVSAFKIGGAWNTNIPAWVVEAGDTNEAALNIEVDRIHLTNNVLMQLDYVDHSNATLMLDLYGFPGTNDPNEPVFTSNLFNNLLSGGGGVTSRTFTIPFGLYTNATGIRLRRDAGAMTIFDTLLSSDRDGDGYSDSEELAWGSDLDSALSVPCAAITGQVFYAGVQTGVIHVLATINSSDWASAHYLTMGIPGVYTLSGLALRQTWYPRAFRDVNGNGIPDDWEPRGGYVAPNGTNSLILADNSGGVNITMTDPDSDGDGMSDAVERALGLDPYTSNSFSHLPFLENFETNTVHLGDVNGQNGWFASPSNTVMVQTSTVYEGLQALALKNGDTPANVHQLFAVSNAPVVWLDVHVQALEGAIPTNEPSGSALMFFDAHGYLKVYNGLSASSNKWVSLTNMPSSGTTGAWVRLTTKLDYSTQRWLVCIDGILAAEGLGFATPVSQFTAVSLIGRQGGMDALAVTTNEPSGLSLDGDHLPDDWELAHFGNLDQTDDGDSDHDGLSNLPEYRAGTAPAQWSTVNDGISDGWKVAHGLNPLDPSIASQDADHDGLSNLGEYLAGTDPQNASSHCWNIAGVVGYAGFQTGVVWVAACTAPTGGAMVAQVSCVTSGAYILAGLPPNSNYWIRAWVDTDGNGSNDFWEAQGLYTNNPVVLHTNVSGISLILTDPDSDGDGMPDWWEIAHGFNPTNPADAVQDTDGDGLNNLAEYQHGTDPHMADTDHDGVTDGTEVQFGSDPQVANTCSQLPFLERFETNTVHIGDVNGQNGWMASPSNTVLVQTGVVWEGAQALALKSGDTPANVRQLFTVTNAPVVWLDVHVQALEGAIPTNAVSGSAIMFFNATGYLKAYDGLSTSSNKWVALTNVPSCETTGTWVRLTTKLDYSTQRWLVCVDGILAAEGLGFATPVSRFTAVSLIGRQGGVDALSVTTNEPAGLSLDGDHLPDDWELANFGNLDQPDNGDQDHDGLTNLQEYQHGTDPNVADSDHDGMPDGWEVTHGFNPTNAADAGMDADGDGLSNASEYQHQSDPLVADTDHDGLTDGMEVNTWHTDPVSADSDGDDYTDADEVARGTDPADPASHPASHWLNHRKLMFREGSLTNRLADVPILVRLTPERIDYTQCAANGRDIFFTDSAGLPLDFEMERWKPGGESFFWVCLPEAGGTNSAGYFWLHWNYPDATNSANAASVWSTNYLGVWHLAETNTVLADSTLGTYAATNVGAVSVTGILGNARNFRGSDSVIVPPAALAMISNAVSISFWQFGATNQPLGVTCFEGTSVIGRELNAHVPWSDGYVYWDAFGNYDRINKLATTNLYKGGWNYWTFTKDRATGIMRIYVNGELWHSGTGKTRAYSPVTAFRFGAAASGSSGYVGMLDELRVESLAQSPEWIRFQYKAMTDQILVYGEQQVSIAGTVNGAEPDQAGEFTINRSVLDGTNLALTVNLAAPGGTATEGGDYSVLPRSVVIPAGASQVTFPVPVIDDLWLEGAETVTVSIAQGNYFISPTNATASIAIGDDDVDSDEDGMCDAWEILKFGNLDATATGDADSDGVNNLQEYLHGTNPHDADTDHDGLPDQWEIAMGTDPLTPDAAADPDKDGLTNLQEYQLGTNPLLADTDGDGMPDKWEMEHGLNLLVNDAALDPDNDGLTNLQEYQHGTDPHNPDTDGDGLTDGAEVNIHHTNPLNPDTDGDGMPDKWEVDNGTNPLVNDASADPDGDQLLNLEECRAGTKPKVADTDGDGVNDKVEIMAYADPIVMDFNGTVTDHLVLNGCDATSWIGTWTIEGSAVYARERSGSLDYVLAIPSNGTFAVAVNVTQQNVLTALNTFDLSLFIDGTFSGRQTVKAPYGTNCTGTFFLPELMAGDHVIRLRWNNDTPNTFLQVNSIKLQSFGGLDANTNGVPDWTDHRMASLSETGPVPESTLVSPICMEGSAVYQERLLIAASYAPGGQTQQIVAVQHGLRTTWFANVFISPTNTTEIVTADQSSGVMVSNNVIWEAVNLLDTSYSNGLAIRGGSSLRLSAWPVEATNGLATFMVSAGTNVITNLVATAGSPIPYCFNQAGNFMVLGTCSNETMLTNGTLAVRVVTASFNGEEAECVTGQARTWDCSGIRTDAVVQADTQLSVSSTNLAGGGTRFTLMNPTDGPLYMVARLGTDGPVLDSAKISSISGDHGTYFKVVETFADGSRMVEVRLQLGYVPSDLTVALHIFVGGVTFLDGTLNKNLTAADFNELGVCTYRMLQSALSRSSTCHTTKLYQVGLYIGGN